MKINYKKGSCVVSFDQIYKKNMRKSCKIVFLLKGASNNKEDQDEIEALKQQKYGIEINKTFEIFPF